MRRPWLPRTAKRRRNNQFYFLALLQHCEEIYEAENCEEETKQQVLFFSFFCNTEEIYEEMTVEAEICEEETKQLVLGFLF